MKLGEALTLRARQAQQLNDLQGRIKVSALVQEGTEPPEDVTKLIPEYLELSSKHADLVTLIQQANATTKITFNGGKWSILQLLQDRAELTRQRNLYGITANAGSPNRDVFRYARSELKYVPMVDVAELRREEEKTSEEIRKLDAAIQAANWETELP